MAILLLSINVIMRMLKSMTKNPKIIYLNNTQIIIQPEVAKHRFINNQVKLLPKILERLEKYLDFNRQNIIFTFKQFSNTSKNKILGLYHFEDAICELNPSQHKETFIKTVCHEMIHSEQYNTGKFVNVFGKRYWNGEELDNYIKNVYDDKVRTNPWEVEAYERENDLQFKVMESLYWDGILKY